MKNKITMIIKSKMKSKNVEIEENVNFITSGYIDSMDFIDIISLIEEEFNIELDFSEVDPADITTISGLYYYIKSFHG